MPEITNPHPDPAMDFDNVTPSDTQPLPRMTRAILVGAAGNLAVVKTNGLQITIPVPVGLLPICVTQVLNTGTTASSLVALY